MGVNSYATGSEMLAKELSGRELERRSPISITTFAVCIISLDLLHFSLSFRSEARVIEWR